MGVLKRFFRSCEIDCKLGRFVSSKTEYLRSKTTCPIVDKPSGFDIILGVSVRTRKKERERENRKVFLLKRMHTEELCLSKTQGGETTSNESFSPFFCLRQKSRQVRRGKQRG